MRTDTGCLLAVLLVTVLSVGSCQELNFRELCPPNEIQASSNVTDLTELTFWGKIADGRVWFVEFYAGW